MAAEGPPWSEVTTENHMNGPQYALQSGMNQNY